MRKLFLLTTMAFIGLGAAKASNLTLVAGDLSKIKDQKQFIIEYDYSSFGVGKFKSEADYVAEKVEAYNKKEAGRGDTWKENWITDRDHRFQPKFEELLNKYLDEVDVDVDKDLSQAKYKMIVKIDFIEPGFNVGVARKPAMLDVKVSIVEVANPSNIVAVINCKKNPGNSFGGNDYDTGERIQESFAKAGKEFGIFLIKNAFKK
jgi:hypothetical protein